MASLRMLVFSGMCLLGQALVEPASANPLSDALSRLPVYLCQLGDTLHAYAFMQGSDDSWIGLGQLHGWNVTMQSDGLVARQGENILILGNTSASLVEQGHLVTGHCADPRRELVQLFASNDLYQELLYKVGDQTTAGQTPVVTNPDAALPNEAPQIAPVDPAADDAASFMDPATWDEEKVAALVDALSLDDPVSLSLKVQLKEAGRDPGRIADVARQIQRALVSNIAPVAQLRSELKEANRNFDAATAALADERHVAQITAEQLANSEARATAAERASKKAAAQYADAQAALRKQDVALKQSSEANAALQQQLTTVQAQAQELQGALTASNGREQAAYALLVDLKARLVRENRKIDDLKAGRN